MNRILSNPATTQKLFGGFLSHEYTVFNWNTGGHWGSSLIHMQRGENDTYNHVLHNGVLDPLHDPDTVRFVHQRMHGVLGALGVTFAPRPERTFWVPQQRDSYSCGLVSAYIKRLLIKRIADQYLPSGPQKYDNAAMWRPARE
ncbi:hypothetical protein PG994_004477 [Apiospora phragmitis]|uniref:Ubiquitin-like protease family profile domain-containing protein n=1 Tax=Apiospora phragmitis TaxID=2905665 RepID=A0ABR1VUQ5_9PEZI